MQRNLLVGIGTSQADSPMEAGRDAATTALAALSGEPPALVIVFASVSYDLPALVSSIRAVTGSAPLVGATSCGQFHEGSYVPVGSGVQVLVLSAGPYRFGATSAQGLSAEPEATGRAVARGARLAAGGELPPHAALLLFTDGLAGNQRAVLNGIYAVTGAAVPVVGGSSADDRRFTGTFVFHDDQVLRDSAVAVWIGSEQPLGVICKHGWLPRGLPMPGSSGCSPSSASHLRRISS